MPICQAGRAVLVLVLLDLTATSASALCLTICCADTCADCVAQSTCGWCVGNHALGYPCGTTSLGTGCASGWLTTCPTNASSTERPSTKVPTTKVPTTKVPTTKVPTTKVPTSVVPTTVLPTTQVPTTHISTTLPSTSAPSADLPTTIEPTTTQQPAPQTTAQPAPQTTAQPAPQTTEQPTPKTTEQPAPQTTEQLVPETTAQPGPPTTVPPSTAGVMTTRTRTHWSSVSVTTWVTGTGDLNPSVTSTDPLTKSVTMSISGATQAPVQTTWSATVTFTWPAGTGSPSFTQSATLAARTSTASQSPSLSLRLTSTQELFSTATSRQTATRSEHPSPTRTVPVEGPVVARLLPAALATTATVTIGTSIFAGGAAGGTSDAQAVLLVLTAPCVTGTQEISSGGYSVVTPFALSDTPLGALGGNAIVFGALFFLLCAFIAFQVRVKRSPVNEAFAKAKFPGLLVVLAASLYQGTLFVAIKLLSGVLPDGTPVGIATLVFAVAFPAATVFAVRRVPRVFVRYDMPSNPTFLVYRLRPLVPTGDTFPLHTRQMMSSILAGFCQPTAAGVLVPFVSAFALSLVAALPPSSELVCVGGLVASGLTHVGLAIFLFKARLFRVPLSNVLAPIGLLLVAAVQFLAAGGNRKHQSSDLAAQIVVTLQLALTVVRTLSSFATSFIEGKMHADPAVEASEILWQICGERLAAKDLGLLHAAPAYEQEMTLEAPQVMAKEQVMDGIDEADLVALAPPAKDNRELLLLQLQLELSLAAAVDTRCLADAAVELLVEAAITQARINRMASAVL